MIRKIRHILNVIVWTIIGSYILLSALLHIPAVQKYTGNCVSIALEKKFGNKVYIESVDLGFLNRLIIDGFKFYDKNGKDMLQASRLSVSIDVWQLLQGKIDISSAQIFGLKANLYKRNLNEKPNYQFVIDSLSSKEKSESKLDLRINSFIIRNGAIRYDRLDMPYIGNKIDLNHINITRISSSISIREVKENSICFILKRLSLIESSGLKINNLTFYLSADKKNAELRNFNLNTQNSHINSVLTKASYTFGAQGLDFKSINGHGNIEGNITIKDFSFLNPYLSKYSPKLNIETDYSINNGIIKINNLTLNSADKSISLKATGIMRPFEKSKKWTANVLWLNIGQHFITNVHKALTAMNVSLPQQVECIKEIHIKGSAHGASNKAECNSILETNVGSIKSLIKIAGESLSINATAKNLKIGEILQNKEIGEITISLNSKGKLKGGKLKELNAKGCIENMQLKQYSYQNSTFNISYMRDEANGSFTISDPNIIASVGVNIKNLKYKPSTNIIANIERINPSKLHLSEKWGNATFSAEINAHTTGNNKKNLCGEISIKDFVYSSASERYTIKGIDTKIMPEFLSVKSDFGIIEIKGRHNLLTLDESILGAIKNKISTIPGFEKEIFSSENNFTLKAKINETRWLNILAGIPFHADSAINVYANVDDSKRSIKANVKLPEFTYNGNKYQNGEMNIDTRNDSIFTKLNIKKILDKNEDILLNIYANAANNRISSTLYLDYNTPTHIKGTLNTQAQFYKDDKGKNTVLLEFSPSTLMVKDSVWSISPSSILYNKSKIQFNNFSISHDKQHIKIDGIATNNSKDSVCIDYADVDVKYILDLVNFHSVTFNGMATGKAYMKSVLKNPQAYTKLQVKDFKFQDGNMGVLYANVRWNKDAKQIDIDAVAKESKYAKTLIAGYVSPARNYINLGITAHNTNIEFLKSFCGSFISDVNAHANGFAQVYGDLSTVNLRGKLIADGSIKVSTLNTVYNLKNDTIDMVPNEIMFNGDTVTDRNGNIAIIRGALHHKNLTKLTYDLDIEADRFLCYDFKSYGNNSFYGTVYGTGQCKITGRPHNIRFDINMTPQRGSFIEYNASDPNSITEQNFISWVNHDNNKNTKDTEEAKATEDEEVRNGLKINDASDMHLNFNINTTPDFTLRVLMDKASGDKIALNGTGAIKASYFNKGSFDMFGTYLIDHGSYGLTIQNIIKKDFQFQTGSSIVFGGNPFNALLNLKAVYPVNGVSLADLKIGNSFSSNNVRVDCIMNISGTPEAINVDFDFDLPTVNNDAKQMIRSLVNSEEELNQQVVYLLAIGRFYVDNKNNSTQENAQQSQTSLAMQSLLSGTISQQMNNILGTVIKDNNWNFGTNISTGTEGFNNAEYEGLLSGRLFSNRLLINGQFGYRDNPNTTSSFIGDFDLKYLLTPSGSIAIKVYNQTNDRYFTKSSLNTQGIGLIMKRDFTNWREMFGFKKRNKYKK